MALSVGGFAYFFSLICLVGAYARCAPTHPHRRVVVFVFSHQ